MYQWHKPDIANWPLHHFILVCQALGASSKSLYLVHRVFLRNIFNWNLKRENPKKSWSYHGVGLSRFITSAVQQKHQLSCCRWFLDGSELIEAMEGVSSSCRVCTLCSARPDLFTWSRPLVSNLDPPHHHSSLCQWPFINTRYRKLWGSAISRGAIWGKYTPYEIQKCGLKIRETQYIGVHHRKHRVQRFPWVAVVQPCAILRRRVAWFGRNTIFTKYRNTALKYEKYKSQGAPSRTSCPEVSGGTGHHGVAIVQLWNAHPPGRRPRKLLHKWFFLASDQEDGENSCVKY